MGATRCLTTSEDVVHRGDRVIINDHARNVLEGQTKKGFTGMKFGAFTTVAASAGEAANAEQMIDNLRQQTILAEDLGFETMWLGEHHFGPYGVGDLPNPILLGADLAARTSRIRIGQMANIAPWWHPIRLAEDLAMLDNMTRGRRGGWIRQGDLAVRGSTVSSQRRPSQGCGEQGAFQGDGGDSA